MPGRRLAVVFAGADSQVRKDGNGVVELRPGSLSVVHPEG
jgi:hypothetical protein